jgi:hypothetical protein
VLFRALKKADVEKGITALRAQKNSDMLRFVGIKFPLDGGVEGARMYSPFRIVPGEQPDAAYRGVLLLPPGGEDEYVEGLKLIAEAGLQAQTHAVGDETIDVIVRAYERVNRDKPIRDLRWTIMHIFHPSDAAMRKMAEIGILATVQDHPVLLGHNQRRWWGDERAADAIPIRKLIDAGILVGGGTDGPVVPVDPFLSMWWMTTRQVLKGYVLGREHAITAKEALQLYTINNARILGVEKERGSIEAGKLADLVVWKPAFFGVKPELVVKGGLIAWAAMGDPNASIPTPQPVLYRPMFGALGRARSSTSVTFVSAAAMAADVPRRLGLARQALAVGRCRGLSKRDMIHNDAVPRIEVDPETYEVRADGERLTCEPARVLPMAQRYFLF